MDDGSSDNTAEMAIQAQARVLRHPENCGYGSALKTGIREASHDIIVIIDADGTYPSTEIPAIVEELEHADMVVGARTGDQVHTSIMRQPAKWVLRRLAERIAEQKIPDLNSGLARFEKNALASIFQFCRIDFHSPRQLPWLIWQMGIKSLYHPINYYVRIGRSKIVPWHFMDFTILIIRMSMMFNPLKVFVPLSFTFGFLGIAKMIYDIFALFARSPGSGWVLLLQPVLSTSAVLLLFVGLQLLILGMVADGVIRRIGQLNRRASTFSQLHQF